MTWGVPRGITDTRSSHEPVKQDSGFRFESQGFTSVGFRVVGLAAGRLAFACWISICDK